MSEILTKQERNRARDYTLKAGVLSLGEFTYASGQEANNKLDMERLLLYREYRTPLLKSMALLAIRNPQTIEAIIGIPRGGAKFAQKVGLLAGIRVIEMEKGENDLGNPVFNYRSRADRVAAESVDSIAIMEDVTTTRSSEALLYAQHPEIRERAEVCITGWDRSTPGKKLPLSVPLEPVIQEPIPYDLFPGHALYEYAQGQKQEEHADDRSF